jgi:Ti-type conjugative transfer relaxase TraA
VAREIVLALPANKELNHEDRVELARSFALAHFVSQGLAVQLDVHAPHAGDSEGERANHHAHLLITTRRVEGDRLAARKARELEPEVRSLSGKPVVTSGELWGETWRAHQDRYFQEQGLELRVDAADAVAQPHVGPIRMRAPDAEIVAELEATKRANAAAARDPVQVLEVLTRQHATFTERDLDRHLAKHLDDEAEHLAIKEKVLGQREVLALYDRASGAATGRYTTRVVRLQERVALRDAGKVAAGRRHSGLGERARAAALAGRGLRADQRAAFEHATGAGGLKLIEGRAGTGKSYTLRAVRVAHAAAGYEVIGLAPTNAVAQDLKAEGFARAGTVHAELFALKNGRVRWGSRTLVVVDEAAMLDSQVTGALLAEAKRSGAKLVLAGDDRQLASIERGGLFAELKQRHGSAEITEVTRQREDWQRQAARDLAAGRTAAAVQAFERHGAITWTGTQDEAKAALVERWKMDTGSGVGGTRFVFAYTNRDVDALNAALRQVRRERGELGAGEQPSPPATASWRSRSATGCSSPTR